MSKKIIAIGITPDKKAYKYHLYNTPRTILSFERFISTKNVEYVNYYQKDNRAFLKRVKINRQ